MILILIIGVLLAGFAAMLITLYDNRRKGLDPYAHNDPARNHRDMARFIEWLLDDEMIRPMLPSHRLQEAMTLRDQYFGTKGTRN